MHYAGFASRCIWHGLGRALPRSGVRPAGHTRRPNYPGGYVLPLDSLARLAFIACDINSALLTVDLRTWRVTATAIVGVEPDVLAFDPKAGRLYVAAESGWVTLLQLHGYRLRVTYSNYLANDALSSPWTRSRAAATSRCSALRAATLPCWCAR